MKSARLIKNGSAWLCITMGKKGESKFPISDKTLIDWLNKNIENTSVESDVLIPENNQLIELQYMDKKYQKSGISSNNHSFQNDQIRNSRNQRYEGRQQRNSQQPRQDRHDIRGNDNIKYARSPYNFIPLNDDVKLSSQTCSHDKYHENRFSGYLNLSIKNLTPLFLRQVSDSHDNFQYGNKYGISGSSMRGMIRTMCEILSFGKMGKVDDKSLYYRAIYHKDPLNNEYKNAIGFKTLKIGSDTISLSGTEAGYLKDNYIITAEKVNGYTYNRKQINSLLKPDDPIKIVNVNSDNSVLIQTGYSTKKKSQYIINPPSSEKLIVSNKVLYSFWNDENRDEKVNKYLKSAEKSCKIGIPIFFKKDNSGNVAHLGHTPFYRIPYNKSIQDHIPDKLHKASTLDDADLVQGLFGDSFDKKNKEGLNMIASRIAFGDVLATNAKPLDQSMLLRILASPKPTSHQHYLEQGRNATKASNTWNSSANIRGNKMYWHRKTENRNIESGQKFNDLHLKFIQDNTYDLVWNEPWPESMDKEPNPNNNNKKYKTDSHAERIKPIESGATFEGKIWFNNLSDVELGLLLSALEPFEDKNDKIAHKIGLAKPLGLGTIKVNVEKVHLMPSVNEYFKSYDKTFIDSSTKKDEFKKTFTSSIAENNYWSQQRLQELYAIMEYDEDKFNKEELLLKTRYMEIERGSQKKNEYKNKRILPTPTQVKSKNISEFVNGNLGDEEL